MQQDRGVQKIIQCVWRSILIYLRLSKTSNQQIGIAGPIPSDFFPIYKLIEHPNSIISIPALYMGNTTLSEFSWVFPQSLETIAEIHNFRFSG
jgi:hypothetical protein